MLRKTLIVDPGVHARLAKWMQDNPSLWPALVRDLLEGLLASGDIPANLRVSAPMPAAISVQARSDAGQDGAGQATVLPPGQQPDAPATADPPAPAVMASAAATAMPAAPAGQPADAGPSQAVREAALAALKRNQF